MNSIQKEIAKSQLKNEELVLKQLEQIYKIAIDDINGKIKELLGDEVTMSKIYQVDYQNALKSQINAILDNMNINQYTRIDDYINDCYKNGYLGAIYDLHSQHIPIIMPINQEQAVQAIINDTKLRKPLYEKLGQDVTLLKTQVASEISRGVATTLSYNDIRRNIQKRTNLPKSNAMRIARTEGHRVTQQATMNAIKNAVNVGADVVKQWDSTMDRHTRPSHQRVDGEIRELDEKFSNGLRYPGDPNGKASEVVNCRCVLLQRARWALDKDELETLNARATYFGLDKTENFNDFKDKYIKVVEDVQTQTILKNCKNFTELTAYFKANYNVDVTNSVTTLHYESVQTSMTGIEKILNEFPKATNYVKSISTNDSGIMCAERKGTINFNPKYFNDGDYLIKVLENNASTGWGIKNENAVSVGAHEMGHLLESTLIELNSDYTANYEKIRAWNKCTEAQKIVSQALKTVKQQTKQNYPDIIKEVSEYAAKDRSECLAECVADYVTNGENASNLSKEIWKLLKGELS